MCQHNRELMPYTDDGFASYGGIAYEETDISEVDVIVQGIPYEATSGKKGTSLAPAHLRLASVDLQLISRWGTNLEYIVLRDMGNIPVYPLDGEKTRVSITEHTSKLLDSSQAPIISIGGDHSITYPLIKALAKKGKVAIIWFDAHRDLLPELVGSKYSHGSSLLRAIELDNVNPQNVLLVGTRYMQSDEQKIIEKYSIRELKMIDLEQSNFSTKQFIDAVNGITNNVDLVYVSVDIDVLDPSAAPGTGTPVAGGLTNSQLLRYIHAIPTPIRMFDIMEVSPPLDCTGITIKSTMAIITEFLAKIYEQKQL